MSERARSRSSPRMRRASRAGSGQDLDPVLRAIAVSGPYRSVFFIPNLARKDLSRLLQRAYESRWTDRAASRWQGPGHS